MYQGENLGQIGSELVNLSKPEKLGGLRTVRGALSSDRAVRVLLSCAALARFLIILLSLLIVIVLCLTK